MSAYDEENVFGKRRGRFDEAMARSAVEEVVSRIVWGFASLSEADKDRAIQAFNRLHDDPRNRVRHRIERRP